MLKSFNSEGYDLFGRGDLIHVFNKKKNVLEDVSFIKSEINEAELGQNYIDLDEPIDEYNISHDYYIGAREMIDNIEMIRKPNIKWDNAFIEENKGTLSYNKSFITEELYNKYTEFIIKQLSIQLGYGCRYTSVRIEGANLYEIESDIFDHTEYINLDSLNESKHYHTDDKYDYCMVVKQSKNVHDSILYFSIKIYKTDKMLNRRIINDNSDFKKLLFFERKVNPIVLKYDTREALDTYIEESNEIGNLYNPFFISAYHIINKTPGEEILKSTITSDFKKEVCIIYTPNDRYFNYKIIIYDLINATDDVPAVFKYFLEMCGSISEPPLELQYIIDRLKEFIFKGNTESFMKIKNAFLNGEVETRCFHIRNTKGYRLDPVFRYTIYANRVYKLIMTLHGYVVLDLELTKK